MTRTYLRKLLPVIVLAGVAAGIWYASRPKVITVTLYSVAAGPVEATVSNTRVGTIKACRRSALAPTMGGEVASLNVREGDRVGAGQVLLEIWNQDLKAQLQLARAQKLAAGMRSQEACKLAKGAEREYNRLRKLQADKLVPEEQVDRMQTDFDAKQAACAAEQASVEVSDAQIHVAESTLERTIVRAPFDGVVAEVNAELGEYVTPSPLGIQTLPAVDLLDLSCLYVSAPIDEVDAPPIKTGMQVCVSLDAFRDRRCSGSVRRIAPYVLEREKQSRTVEVEVVLSDPAAMAGLLPGYSADIEIILDRRERVLRIPTEAVLEGSKVYLYEPATGMLHMHTIEAGLSNWNFTEVRSGLAAGDQIVVSIGREGVKEGARVVPEAGTESQTP